MLILRPSMAFYGCAVVLTALSVVQHCRSVHAQDQLEQEIIKTLSSKNPWPGELPRSSPRGPHPIFPRKYDWDSQAAVELAIETLCRSKDVASWEAMVNAGEGFDSVYSISLKFNGRPIGNFSVSRMCRLIATQKLLYPIASALGRIRVSQPGYLSFLEQEIGVREVVDRPCVSVVSWRRSHAALTFPELQEKAIRRSIESIEKDERLDVEIRREVVKKLRTIADSLRDDKELVQMEVSLFGGPYETYSEETAREVFLEYAKKFREDFSGDK
jgi:hypothetical protein